MTLTISKVATFYKTNIKKKNAQILYKGHPLVTSKKNDQFFTSPQVHKCLN